MGRRGADALQANMRGDVVFALRTVEALRRTPVENLFAETDESDVPIEEIYRRIAQAKDLDPELLKCAIYRNYREIFER